MEGSVEVRIQHLIVVLCQLQEEAKGDRFSALPGWKKELEEIVFIRPLEAPRWPYWTLDSGRATRSDGNRNQLKIRRKQNESGSLPASGGSKRSRILYLTSVTGKEVISTCYILSSSPPTFVDDAVSNKLDGKVHFSGKPLIINEGGLLNLKKPMEVIGKGENIISDISVIFKKMDSPIESFVMVKGAVDEASTSNSKKCTTHSRLDMGENFKAHKIIVDVILKLKMRLLFRRLMLQKPLSLAPNAWTKKNNINVTDLDFRNEFTGEDKVVKVHLSNEWENLVKLQNSLVIKVKEKGEEKLKFKRGKRKMQKAFWADITSESSKKDAEEEITNLCLMANDNLDQSYQNEEEKSLQYSLSPTRRGGVSNSVFTLLATAKNLLVFLPPVEGRVPRGHGCRRAFSLGDPSTNSSRAIGGERCSKFGATV
ncbi:hypothetical protein MA16_Dca018305 [Dendrobium catenatum]|uniref:Uncharacterized protein n=1 Tax=Dendrobium catenatum TaxID=906689 RepID=A0A2I0WJG8_9ASPA|nr:hypothetical protein MA16_Dca018305 [Dendrobium catenatum]